MPKGVRPVNARVNKADALQMRIEGASLKQIAAKYQVTTAAVSKNITHIIKYLNDPAIDHYKQNKIKAMTAVEMLYIDNLLNPETVQKASANNSAYALAQVNSVRRLEEGLATTIVDMHSQISSVSANIKELRNLIDNTPNK